MAKKTHLINAFEGGQNSSADPRDISRNESISIKNLNTNRFGKLVMSGKFVEHEATLGTLAGSGGQEENKINTSFTGTGLFHFSSDYNILDGSGEYLTTDPTGESDIFLLYHTATDSSAANKTHSIFQKTAAGALDWSVADGDADIALGGATANSVFYNADGAIRILDADGIASNENKWFGLVTPKVYGGPDEQSGSTRAYGSFATTAKNSVDRNNAAPGSGIPKWHVLDQEIKGAFPETDNGDGDSVCENSIAAWGNDYAGYGEILTIQSRTYPDTSTNKVSVSQSGVGGGEDSIADESGKFNSFGWLPQDRVTITGFDGALASNNGTNLALHATTAATSLPNTINFVDDELGGGDGDEDDGTVVTIHRTATRLYSEMGGAGQQLAGFGFNGEMTEIGKDHDSGAEGLSATWGAGLLMGTGGEGSGTWMPDDNVRYKFYISTMYDNGTQESKPQLMAMYGPGQQTIYRTYKAAKATSEIYLARPGDESLGGLGLYYTTPTSNLALHLKPIIKLVGTNFNSADADANEDSYAFGASSATATSGGNPRISGVRMYWASSEDGYQELWQLFDCDFHKGTKAFGMDNPSGGTGGYAPWQSIGMYPSSDYSNTNGYYSIPNWSLGNKFIHPPRYNTYFANNGHDHDDTTKLDRAKTIVVSNRRAYAGNVVQTIDGSVEKYPDRILKSPVNQFDKFPSKNAIACGSNDGDAIVHLATFADRLLQFNKQIMYIINIAQASEFMETKHAFKGISHHSAVCTTDLGVAWANEHGAYFYDGQQVIDILESKGQRIIPEDEWSTFATDPMVGYVPKTRQVIFVDSKSDTGNGSTFVYDVITKSLTRGSDRIEAEAYKSNFINDYNGDLIYYDYVNNAMMKWDTTATLSSAAEYITKDIDFDNPAIRKRIYKVYITYKGNGTFPTVTYGVNGDSTPTNAVTTVTAMSNNNEWAIAEYKFGSDANNCYSFQLKLAGAAPADFEINDISIVYRDKRVK